MLGQFSASAAQANVRYRDFVLDGLGETHRPEFYGGPEDSRLLGNDCFLEKCLSRSGEALIPVRITAREIIDQVCAAYAIDATRLGGPSQERIASEARAVVGWLARGLGCATLTEVAKLVNRDVGSISSVVRRLSDRMREMPKLAARVKTLKTAIEAT